MTLHRLLIPMSLAFGLAMATFGQNSGSVAATPTSAPTLTPQTMQAVCNPFSEQVFVSDWNRGDVRILCGLNGGTVVSNSVLAPGVKKILPFGSELNFVTFSMSGRVRHFVFGQESSWLINGNGTLSYDTNRGFVLANPWEHESQQLAFWADGIFTGVRVPSRNFCTSSASTVQGVTVCALGYNKVVTVTRPTLYTGVYDTVAISFSQFPVGAVALNGKLYVMLATEASYPSCGQPICGPTSPISVLPGKIVEISFDYGQSEVRQNLILDGLDVQSNSDTNRFAAGNDSLYFVSGVNKIIKFTPRTRETSLYFDAGPDAFIGAIAVVPGN
jgi:hypothetical protein